MFSGEESHGRYLDLHESHNTYNNLKNVKKRVSYLQYLDLLMIQDGGTVHSDLPREVRLSKDYDMLASDDQPDIILSEIFKQLYNRDALLCFVIHQTHPTSC